MKVYFYTYEYNVDRETGLVHPDRIQASTIEPSGEYGELILWTQEVEPQLLDKYQIAEKAVAMLEAKRETLKTETTSKLEDIADKLVTYKLLTHDGGE